MSEIGEAFDRVDKSPKTQAIRARAATRREGYALIMGNLEAIKRIAMKYGDGKERSDVFTAIYNLANEAIATQEGANLLPT